jgi:hypothetical protein
METMQSVATGAMRERSPCSWPFGFSCCDGNFPRQICVRILTRPLSSTYEARWGNQEHGTACWMARVQGPRDEQLLLLQPGQRSHLGLYSPPAPTKVVLAVEMSAVYSTGKERERERGRERETERRTDGQTDKQTDRQKQTDRETEIACVCLFVFLDMFIYMKRRASDIAHCDSDRSTSPFAVVDPAARPSSVTSRVQG